MNGISDKLVMESINSWVKKNSFKYDFKIKGPMHVTCAMREPKVPFKNKTVMGGEVLYLAGAYLGKKDNAVLRFLSKSPRPDVKFFEFSVIKAMEYLDGFSDFCDKELRPLYHEANKKVEQVKVKELEIRKQNVRYASW